MASTRLEEFDIWRPGYGFASVSVLIGGTTQLAPIFLDEACTQPAVNPQTLIQQTNDGISYGKWVQPLYTEQPYELSINSVDRTGVVPVPLVTLEDEDASLATVIPTGASVAGNLDDILARRIDVRDYGIFTPATLPNASAITNNGTLTSAIAAAGSAGGGYVEIPGGTYQFTTLSLPAGVKLRGVAEVATVLQSLQKGAVVTLTGPDAGFDSMTLDGVNQVTGSIGLFAADIDNIHLEHATIKRFDTDFQQFGGSGSHWKDFSVSDASTAGYQPHGFSDDGKGGPITNQRWDGGNVELCAGIGIDLQYVDSAISNLIFSGIGFSNNTGTAAQVVGGHQIKFDERCWWAGNTVDLLIDDAGPLSAATQTTEGIEIQDSSFAAAIAAIPASGQTAPSPATQGTITLNNTLAALAFRRCTFSDTAININSPLNNILAEDCDEISNVSLGGNSPIAWNRLKSFSRGSTAGLTTDNSDTIAWLLALDPGQCVCLTARVVARCRNTTDTGFWYLSAFYQRPGSVITVRNTTGPFTAGNVVTGQSSGATARITNVAEINAVPNLTVQDIVGTFIANEIITDTGTGSGLTQAAAVGQHPVQIGTTTVLAPTNVTDANWSVSFQQGGIHVDIHVQGDTGYNVEWQVDVDVVTLG